MKYLLDVNALIALGITHHIFHDRVRNWLLSIAKGDELPGLATCSVSELGFVRITMQPAFGFTLQEARQELHNIKNSKNYNFTFIDDGNDASKLPDWATTPPKITDGHLSQLAKAKGLILATLDTKIPDTFVIPV